MKGKKIYYVLLPLVFIAIIASLYPMALNGEYHTKTFPLGYQKISGEAGEIVSCEYVSFWREPSIIYYWDGQKYNTDEFGLTGLSAECQENKRKVEEEFNDKNSKISFECFADSNVSGSGSHEIYCIKGVAYSDRVLWYGERVVGYDEMLYRERCTLIDNNNTVKAFVEYYPLRSFEDLMQTLFPSLTSRGFSK